MSAEFINTNSDCRCQIERINETGMWNNNTFSHLQVTAVQSMRFISKNQGIRSVLQRCYFTNPLYPVQHKRVVFSFAAVLTFIMRIALKALDIEPEDRSH